MAIYKGTKNQPEKVNEWLAKNEHLGVDKYFMFSIETDSGINVDREDFKYTIQFKETFDSIYWDLLEELELEKLT